MGPEAAKLKGLSMINSFFAPLPPPPKRGRPPGSRVERRGRPQGLGVPRTSAAGGNNREEEPARGPSEREAVLFAAEPEQEQVDRPAASATVTEPEEKDDDQEEEGEEEPARKMRAAGLKRTNWSKGDDLKRLTTAVDNWLQKQGELLSADPNMSLHTYAKRVNIPKATLGHYIHPDPSKRRRLGSQAGQPSLVDSETQKFLVDVMRRRDRGNDGMNRREAVAMLQDLKPDLSRQQLSDTFRNTVRRNHSSELTNIVKAQASTTKRGQITVAQQFRWHQAVDSAFRQLREWNTGALSDGRTFAEVMAHFVAGGDETCFLASAGDVKIIGDKQKKKHELASANSRVSTTIYRVGFSSGDTGPTAFLPPGVRRKTGYTDKFLTDHGASPGAPLACPCFVSSVFTDSFVCRFHHRNDTQRLHDGGGVVRDRSVHCQRTA